jgi:hypothetical protein
MKKLDLNVSTGDKPTDPFEIFKRLTLRGGIENIWETQAEALKEWHFNHRAKNDVVIQMNTGGGKTLVGLLMAQSLANENKGRVLYVCANNQLVEQTHRRADEIGLSPAMRYGGKWSQQAAFETGETFCLTNYHTLFNGRSIFLSEPVDALVFDDAHVAEGTIRNCFTVTVPATHTAFKPILQILRRHFANSPRATHFQEVADGEFTPVLFVPMFVTWQHAEEIRRVLVENKVAEDSATKFSWEHIEGHLNQCCILMTGAGMEITPGNVPLSVLPYFNNAVRRLYLTATLPSQTAFARAFGVVAPVVVKPSGRSGDAQRLFVFAPGEDDDKQREAAKRLVARRKSCVISPSKKMADQWVPPSRIYDANSGQQEIDRFRESSEPEMLGLVARYDGIDLPGKSCNVLVLDRLPSGETLIDRFLDEGVKVDTIRLSHTATRVAQAIGRIFRSNTDHGVVIIVGPRLQSWLRNFRHHEYLPSRLQQQIQLGGELLKQVESGNTDWAELIEGVLTGHENWDATYEGCIDQFRVKGSATEADWYAALVPEERNAYERLWEGQPGQAADQYGQLADKAAKHDLRLTAWYRHWRGLALMCANDRARAFCEFAQAANIRSELGRPSEDVDAALKPQTAKIAGKQASNLAAWYCKRKIDIFNALRQVEMGLQYGSETGKAEEALKLLGSLLGLHAERPDNEKKVGPDVLWSGEGGPAAWGFELKTNKNVGSKYTKNDDIGQCHNHEAWMSNEYGDSAMLAIVGRFLPVSKQANPSAKLQVIELDEFRELLTRVRKAIESVDGGDKTNLEVAFQTWLNQYGLLWPNCVESLASRLAVDLKED